MNQANLLVANSEVPVEVADRSPAPSHETAKLAFEFLWLFTLVVYARPQDIFPALNPLRLPLVFGACAGLTYLGALFSGRTRPHWPRELALVLLLTGWFILGVPFAYWRGGSFQVLTQTWLKTLFIFFLLTQTLTSVGRVRKLLWAIILSELISTTASVVLQGKEAIQEGIRLAGVNQGILSLNYFGIAVAVTIPYMAALYVSHRSLVRTGALLTALTLMIWMLVLTASRGGFLNVTFSIILTWWFVLRRSLRGRVMGLIVALCLAVAAAKAPDMFWLRIQTVWNSSQVVTNTAAVSAEQSTQGRILTFERSINYTLQHPIFGVGLGNFPMINGTDLARPSAWVGTHNTFTQVSSEAGIPALALFLLLWDAVFRHARNASKEFARDPASAESYSLARATLVSIASFAFAAFLAHLAYDYYFYYPAGIAAGLWAIARQGSGAPQRYAEPSKPSPAIPSMKCFTK